MSESLHERAFQIFEQACDLPPEAQQAFVEQACAEQEELYREVLSLLRHDRSDADFEAALVLNAREVLNTPASGTDGLLSDDAPLPERIGKYRIIRRLGVGGMGEVFEAEQESPRRRVALKIIRAAHLTPKLVRRFEHEAFVLGQLQHPGIAHIYESGMVEMLGRSQPYFAMELLDGLAITAHADQQRLNTRQRLELMARVCDAVQHAHQKGIIHRDLKPANVLVVVSNSSSDGLGPLDAPTPTDDIGQPKILDFGIARVTDNDVQTATLQTEVGQLVGTLAYMSPEQVAGDSEKLDTRSDVYAIGVLLFQLLSGRMPLELSGTPVAEAARIVREVDPPRLSSVDAAFRGDLDTIVSKAIEKDPERRYESAAALADELRRYLRSEPISAHPPSTLYQLRKFAGRNRILVAGMATTLVALVLGLIGTFYGLMRAREESERLARVVDFQGRVIERIDVQELGEELVDEIRSEFAASLDTQSLSDEARNAALASLDAQLNQINATNLARRTLDEAIASRATQVIDQGYTSDPLVEADLRESVAHTYRFLGMFEKSVEPTRRALELRRQHLGELHPKTLKLLGTLGIISTSIGNLNEAEACLRTAMDGQRRVLGPDSFDAIRSTRHLGIALKRLGKIEEAEALIRQSIDSSTRQFGREDAATLDCINELAVLLIEDGRSEAAIEYLDETLQGFTRMFGPDDLSVITARNNIMTCLFKANRLEEAEPIAQEVVASVIRVRGNEHPLALAALNNLGMVQMQLARYDAAEQSFRQAHALSQQALSPTNDVWMKSLSNLIDVQLVKEQFEEAERDARRLLEVRRENDGITPGAIAQTLEQLARALHRQERYAEAETAWRECVELRESVDPEHWLTNRARSELGAALVAQDRYAEAESLLLPSYAALEAQAESIPKVAGAGCLAGARARLCTLYNAWGKPEEALRWQPSTES
ncbi:MAG: serine/threonine-protein kinase [Planctomycetota bacterium]